MVEICTCICCAGLWLDVIIISVRFVQYMNCVICQLCGFAGSDDPCMADPHKPLRLKFQKMMNQKYSKFSTDVHGSHRYPMSALY